MLAFNGENFPIAVTSIYLCVVLSGAIVSGTVAGMTDMSPNYAGNYLFLRRLQFLANFSFLSLPNLLTEFLF